MPIAVEGLRETVRDLQKVGVEVEDLKDVFGAIAAEAAEVAARHAPSQSGALRNSVRGNRAKGKAVIMAGRARVPYAGAINYGWPKRNIKGRMFLQEADKVMETRAPEMFEEGLAAIFEKIGFTE